MKFPRILELLLILVKIPCSIKNFSTFLYYYFFGSLEKEPIVIKFWNGLKVLARPGTTDFDILITIFIRKDYPVCSKMNILIDIGAHVGYFTLFQHSKNPDSKIFSFEPSEQNYSLLETGKGIRLIFANNFF